MAYEFVNESEVRRYRSDCSAVLKKTCEILKNENDIISQFTLIGSGARNMVTRNGDGPFDLDYNLEIIKAPDEYLNNPRKLKDTVRVALDEAVGIEGGCFSDSQDSKSCLTAILHFKDSSQVEFKFDVAIIRKNKNSKYMRLINNKHAGLYIWNEAPDPHSIKDKADILKHKGLWNEVRERYLELKNMYLGRQGKIYNLNTQNTDKPSFIIYIEAVNEIYGKHF